MTGSDSLTESRPRFGFWTYRWGFSVVVGGYGVALGPARGGFHGWLNWMPVWFFRNAAYRGLFS